MILAWTTAIRIVKFLHGFWLNSSFTPPTGSSLFTSKRERKRKSAVDLEQVVVILKKTPVTILTGACKSLGRWPGSYALNQLKLIPYAPRGAPFLFFLSLGTLTISLTQFP